MNRITEKVEGYICINPEDNECPTMSFCQYCDIPVNRCLYFEGVIKKLAKYEDLEEQGLLHIAPLKDGIPIYAIVEDCVDFGEKERYIVRSSYLHGVTEYEFGELNKDFFTSEQAAENYLRLRSSKVIADLEEFYQKWMKTNV